MLVIGLTGGIATGKSTASKYLSEQKHIPVIDTDKIAREIVAPGLPAYNSILAAFPEKRDILINQNTLEINRPALASIIFNDASSRRILNSIMHKRIGWEVMKQIFYHFITFERICVVDVPLLFESGWHNFVGTSILIYCDPETQERRLMARDSILNAEEAQKKITAQFPLSKKAELSDFIVSNDEEGNLDPMHRTLDMIIEKEKPSLLHNLIWYLFPSIMLPVYFLRRNLVHNKIHNKRVVA